MPVAYYIIPMVAGPYSRSNPQRPDYVDEIRCNWTGHNVDALGVYICKVNTTAAKHADLAGRANVRQLPDWDVLISSLKTAQRNAISNWLANHNLPYDSAESIGQLLMRVLCSGLWGLSTETLTTTVGNLSQAKQDKIATLCQRWGIAYSTEDTIRALAYRAGAKWWHGPSLNVEEY